MPERVHFAVMGDMHYVQPDVHRQAFGGRPRGVTELADLKRNLWMTQNVTPRVIRSIANQRPDFVIQTGDFIQGHCDDEAGNRREMSEGLEMIQGVQAPLFFALGTHDGRLGDGKDTPLRQLLLPTIGRSLGRPLERSYYSFTKGESLFVVLDYTTFRPGGEQELFLRRTLASADEYAHVFLFAHPPLIPIGRPFFSSYGFCTATLQAISHHPVDAYFCGHTHNQVATIHRVGEAWLPQLKSTVLGYPDEVPVFLNHVRPLLPDPNHYELGWAFLEDSAPSWWFVTVDGDEVHADWHILDAGVQGRLNWRRGEKPRFVHRPAFSPGPQVLPTSEEIKRIRLRAAGSRCSLPESYSISLNGETVGHLPRLEYFDCRQFLELLPSQWPLVRQHNTLQVTTSAEEMCVGGFVLEVQTARGWSRTKPSPYFYTNTNRWDMWNALPVRHISPGESITVLLSFADEGNECSELGSTD